MKKTHWSLFRWRHVQACWREVPHAHTSCSRARNGAEQSLERSGQRADSSRLPRCDGAKRLHGDEHCGYRSRGPTAVAEVDLPSFGASAPAKSSGRRCFGRVAARPRSTVIASGAVGCSDALAVGNDHSANAHWDRLRPPPGARAHAVFCGAVNAGDTDRLTRYDDLAARG
jgi:hypothetical protein